MSTIGREGADLLARAAQGKYVEETLAMKRKQERLARLKRGAKGAKTIADKKPKRKGHHEKRMESVKKQLRTGVYDRPEFSASIPDESSTVASLTSGGRSGLQLPPVTPPRRSGPSLVRTMTPLDLTDYEGNPVQAPKGKPKKGYRKSKDKKKTAQRAARAKAAAPKAKPRREPIVIPSGSDADSDAATIGSDSDLASVEFDEETDAPEEAKAEDTESESETDESDTSSEYGMDPLDFPEARQHAIERYKKQQRYLALRRRNPVAFLAVRSRQKKARQEQKRQRLAARHGHHHQIRTHTPFTPKLQISQQGPGQFKVRSTGLSPAIRKQVKSLLGRLKGKLFVNGKFTSPKRSFAVIMALLTKKQVIQIQVK